VKDGSNVKTQSADFWKDLLNKFKEDFNKKPKPFTQVEVPLKTTKNESSKCLCQMDHFFKLTWLRLIDVLIMQLEAEKNGPDYVRNFMSQKRWTALNMFMKGVKSEVRQLYLFAWTVPTPNAVVKATSLQNLIRG
jgi:hypothetical protein